MPLRRCDPGGLLCVHRSRYLLQGHRWRWLLGCGESAEISGDLLAISDHEGISDTMAHEFLHAVYIRLSATERGNLDSLLRKTYKDNQTPLDEFLRPYGFTYADDIQKMNELYSFIGTKIEKLPPELEDHYKHYFQDRSVILALSKDQPPPPHADTKPPEFKPLQPQNPATAVENETSSRPLNIEPTKSQSPPIEKVRYICYLEINKDPHCRNLDELEAAGLREATEESFAKSADFL